MTDNPLELFNPFDPAVQLDPYPSMHKLRELAPVLDTPIGATFFSRWTDCSQILRDPHFSSSPEHQEGGARLMREQMAKSMGFERLHTMADTLLLFLDPPDHSRIRQLVTKAFTPRTVELLRPKIDDLVAGLLDDAAEKGDMDLIPDLAYPLPVIVICELLGIPPADHERFQGWSKTLAAMIDPIADPSLLAGAEQAVIAFDEFFHELLEERRRRPGDDLLTALLHAEEEGERLSEDELLSLAILLLVAGHETTMNLIGNGMLALFRHPDQLQRLREDPSLTRNAIEEFLRFDPPVQFTARTATADVAVGGRTMHKGDGAFVLIGAANRDPAQFPEPDRLDVARPEANRHLAFSSGIHYCLGAALARVEAQSAIGQLVARFPRLAQAGEERRRPNLNLRGLESLPMVLG